MKQWLGLGVLLLALGQAAAKTPVLVQPVLWKTSEGMQVYHVYRPHMGFVDMGLVIGAGSAHDGHRWGLAHLTALGLTQGSQGQSRAALAAGLDRLGASMNTRVGRDHTVITLRSMTRDTYLKQAFPLWLKALAQPTFPEADIHQLKARLMHGLHIAKQQASDLADRQLMQTLYGKHPYAHQPVGTIKRLKAITSAHCQQFYQHHYQPRYATLVIVGDVPAILAHRLAAQVSRSLPKDQGPEQPPLPHVPPHPRHQNGHVTLDKAQTTLLVGGLGVSFHNPDRFAMLVANQMLGGGMEAMLFKAIRQQRGLAYGARSHVTFWEAKGPWVMALKTRTHQAKQAEKVLHQVLRDAAQGQQVSAMLQATKQTLRGQWLVKLSDNAGIFSAMVFMAQHHLAPSYLNDELKRLEGIRADDIKRVLARYLQPTRLITVSVGRETHGS